VFTGGLAEASDGACYRAMDFLPDALGELQEEVFFAVANLRNLEAGLVFSAVGSTCWKCGSACGNEFVSAGFRTGSLTLGSSDFQAELAPPPATLSLAVGPIQRSSR